MLVDFQNAMAKLAHRFNSEGYDKRAVQVADQLVAEFVESLKLFPALSASEPTPGEGYVDFTVGQRVKIHVRLSYDVYGIGVAATTMGNGFKVDRSQDPGGSPGIDLVRLTYRLYSEEWEGPEDPTVIPVPGQRKATRLPIEMIGEAFVNVIDRVIKRLPAD